MRLLVIAAMMLSSVSAFASSEGGSEYFWQAGAGKTYLIPELEYSTADYDVKTGGEVDSKETEAKFSAEYGFNEHMSFGATIGYLTGETDTGASTEEEKGLTDIKFYMKGSHALSGGALKYGAALGVSPGKREQKTADEYNAYSGRYTFTPYVGYETQIGQYKAGAKVSYELALTDAKEEDTLGVETEYSGNDELEVSLFTERSYGHGNLGLALAHARTSDRKNESSGAKEEVPSMTGLEIYTDYTVNESLTLLGEFAYRMYGSTDVFDDGSGFGLLIGARLAL